jgi:hypothetical protein
MNEILLSDLGELLADLQVPYSIGLETGNLVAPGQRVLDALKKVYSHLDLFGYPNGAQIAGQIAALLHPSRREDG